MLFAYLSGFRIRWTARRAAPVVWIDDDADVSIPDPVLDKAAYQRDLAFANQLEGQARIDALAKLQPAHQARNHAASPVVPDKAQ